MSYERYFVITWLKCLVNQTGVKLLQLVSTLDVNLVNLVYEALFSNDTVRLT